MAKKTYNPFKMWGSYVGLIIGAISGFLSAGQIITDYSVPQAVGFLGVTLSIPGAIIGFLIGWGIHSLIRSNN